MAEEAKELCPLKATEKGLLVPCLLPHGHKGKCSASPPRTIEICARYSSQGAQTSFSFACPHCRFRNRWESEQQALTKVSEHLRFTHQIRLSIPRDPASVPPRTIPESFEEFLKALGIPLSSPELKGVSR